MTRSNQGDTGAQGCRLRLSDGRAVAYCEVGAPDGAPVLFCHGWPSSRLEVLTLGSAAARVGVRLIGLDRPGVGQSDPQADRSLARWPADVAAVMDQLGIGRFGVLGVSAGGMYAAACASALSERVGAVAFAGALAGLDVPAVRADLRVDQKLMLAASVRAPVLLRPMLAWMRRAARSGTLLDTMERSMAAADRNALAQSEIREPLRAGVAEAFAGKLRGIADDLAVVARGGPAPAMPSSTEVFVWHGESDRNSPVAMGRYLAARYPAARVTFLAGEGHLIAHTHGNAILQQLAPGAARGSRHRSPPAPTSPISPG